MGLKLSIDPGTTREHPLGVCWWFNGKPIEAYSIKPKPRDYDDRCRFLISALEKHMQERQERYHKVETIAVEAFIRWVPPNRQYAIRQLSRFSGYLQGYFEGLGLHVIEVDKGQTPKAQARMLGKQYGFDTEDQDACDALLVGFLAGFGR
jgi:hypothetical protein